jgi:hypothetical protein
MQRCDSVVLESHPTRPTIQTAGRILSRTDRRRCYGRMRIVRKLIMMINCFPPNPPTHLSFGHPRCEAMRLWLPHDVIASVGLSTILYSAVFHAALEWWGEPPSSTLCLSCWASATNIDSPPPDHPRVTVTMIRSIVSTISTDTTPDRPHGLLRSYSTQRAMQSVIDTAQQWLQSSSSYGLVVVIDGSSLSH